jgi:hypothetical protein
MKALKTSLSDRSADVCVTAVKTLDNFGCSASNNIPVLIRVIKDSKDPSAGAKCAALQTLGKIDSNSPEAISALTAALNDPSEFVRNVARQELGRIRASGK